MRHRGPTTGSTRTTTHYQGSLGVAKGDDDLRHGDDRNCRALETLRPRAGATHAQIAALVSQIVIINAFNRLNVILGRPGGDYRVGQFG